MTDPRLLTGQELEAIRRDVRNGWTCGDLEYDPFFVECEYKALQLLDHIDALNEERRQ